MLIEMRHSSLFAVALIACTTGDEPLPMGDVQSSVVSLNKLAANKLAANKLAANKLAANKLAANKLELNKLGSEELLATPEGREVLTYLISCAVPEGVTLLAASGDVTYEFFGELGLAPEWIDHSLNRTGEGWVSACMFSRVNAHSVALPVSLRGKNPALTVDADERTNWSVEEGGFYGQFFTPGDDPINWNACRGEGQASGEFGGLVSRDCAEPDPAHPGLTLCGFNYAGDCGDFAARHACKKFSENGTFYQQCLGVRSRDDNSNHRVGGSVDTGHVGSFERDAGGDRKFFDQVITTYVTP